MMPQFKHLILGALSLITLYSPIAAQVIVKTDAVSVGLSVSPAVTDPPLAISSFSAETVEYIPGAAEGEIDLKWISPEAGAVDVKLQEYHIRWSELSVLDAPFTGDTTSWWNSASGGANIAEPSHDPGLEFEYKAEGLNPGATYYFAIKAVDQFGNISQIDELTQASQEEPLEQAYASASRDNIPPAAVADLEALPGPDAGEITLSWTATGDDGALGTATAYQIRYATFSIDSLGGDTAAWWMLASTAPAVPEPEEAGTSQTYTISDRPYTSLPAGMHYFAIKAVDKAGNWSPIDINAAESSQAASERKPYIPETVMDLSAFATDTQGEVRLVWTAPAAAAGIDDKIHKYSIRYATFSVAELAGDATSWWNSAIEYAGSESVEPLDPGEEQEYTIKDTFTELTTHYFGIKSVNTPWENWSDLDAKSDAGEQDGVLPFFPEFVLSGLEVNPDEVYVNQDTTLSVIIENIGPLEGSYTAEFYVGGSTLTFEVPNLTAGSTTTASVEYSTGTAGVYEITAKDLTEDPATLTVYDYPAVATREAEDIHLTTATIKGELLTVGLEEGVRTYFRYREAEEVVWSTTTFTFLTSADTFTEILTGLEVDTTYYYQAVGEWNSQVSTGAVMTFKTLKPAEFLVIDLQVDPEKVYLSQNTNISVTVENVGDIEEGYTAEFYVGGSTLTYEISALPGRSATTVSVVYSTDTAGEYEVTAKDTIETATLTVYEYPAVATLAAEAVAISSATLIGELLEAGFEEGVTTYFRYREAEEVDWSTTPLSYMTSTGTFAQQLTGLISNTTYQYQAVGEWDAQMSTGAVLTFQTLPAPAEFLVSDLQVDPENVYVSQKTTFSATVENVGDLEDSYTAEFYVGGSTLTYEISALAGRSATTVSVVYSTDTAGEYIVTAKDTTDTETLTVYDYPAVATLAAEAVEISSATLKGELLRVGLEEGVITYFRYREAEEVVWSTTTSTFLTSAEAFAQPLTGLISNTTYQYQAVGEWDVQMSTGAVLTFQTLPAPAEFLVSDLQVDPENVYLSQKTTFSVTVENLGDLEDSYTAEFYVGGSTLTYEISALAGRSVTTVSVVYSTDTAGEYIVTAKDTTDTEILTVYEYPEVETLEAEAVSISSATLRGELLEAGFEEGVTTYFRYRRADEVAWSTTTPVYLTSIGTFKEPLTGLISNTTYQYQAVGEWNAQISTGAVLTFKTLPIPVSPLPVSGLRIKSIDSDYNVTVAWNRILLDVEGEEYTEGGRYEVRRSSVSLIGPWTTVYEAIDTDAQDTYEWIDSTGDAADMILYYKILPVNKFGITGDPSAVVDTSEDRNVYYVSEDGRLRLEFPGSVSYVLYEENNEYGEDIVIQSEKGAPYSGDMLVAYTLQAIGAKKGEGIGIDFDPPGFKLSISLEGTDFAGGFAQQSADTVSMYWYNGIEWIELGGSIDNLDNFISIYSRSFGPYALKSDEAHDTFTITSIQPDKIFTPRVGYTNFIEFKYSNPKSAEVKGRIYNVNGAYVADMETGRTQTLDNESGSLEWDGKDRNGNYVSGGVYIYQIEVSGTENKILNGTVIIAR